MQNNAFSSSHPLVDEFKDFIRNPAFPCVGAKAAASKEQMTIVVCRSISSAWDDLRIHSALMEVARLYREDPKPFRSLAILFDERRRMSERGFEDCLWERVQSLTDKDEWLGQRHDPRVSEDPDNPHFATSFGGEAFFIVGLHPNASRPARRFSTPAMIFNLHDQFELLRASGQYQKLHDAIISRDVDLAGSPNPMLAGHGTSSAARQYSGRMVGDAWACPFQREPSSYLDELFANDR